MKRLEAEELKRHVGQLEKIDDQKQRAQVIAYIKNHIGILADVDEIRAADLKQKLSRRKRKP